MWQFIFLVTLFLKTKKVAELFLAIYVVFVVLFWVVKQTNFRSLTSLIITLMENAVKHHLSDGLSISSSFYCLAEDFLPFLIKTVFP